MNKSCCTHEGVMSHTLVGRITRMNESCLAHECYITCISMCVHTCQEGSGGKFFFKKKEFLIREKWNKMRRVTCISMRIHVCFIRVCSIRMCGVTCVSFICVAWLIPTYGSFLYVTRMCSVTHDKGSHATHMKSHSWVTLQYESHIGMSRA